MRLSGITAVLGLAALLAMALPLSLQAEPAALRVGLIHTEPWAYYTQDKSGERKSQLTGVFVEINKALAREANLQLDPVVLPYGRVRKEIQAGHCDLTYLTRPEDKDGRIAQAGLLFSFQSIILTRPEINLRQYEDLQGLRIGVVRDARLNPRFDNDSELQKHEVRDYETLVDMFISGRMDAIAGNSISLTYLLRKRGYPNQHWPRLVLQNVEVWAQMARRSSQHEALPQITAAIDRLRGDGFFETLLQRYLNSADFPGQTKRLMRDSGEVSLTSSAR